MVEFSSDNWMYWLHLKGKANEVSILTTFGSPSPKYCSTIYFRESYLTNYRFNCLFTSEQCFEKGFVDLCLFNSRLLFAKNFYLYFRPRLNTKKPIEFELFSSCLNEIWFLIFMIVTTNKYNPFLELRLTFIIGIIYS